MVSLAEPQHGDHDGFRLGLVLAGHHAKLKCVHAFKAGLGPVGQVRGGADEAAVLGHLDEVKGEAEAVRVGAGQDQWQVFSVLRGQLLRQGHRDIHHRDDGQLSLGGDRVVAVVDGEGDLGFAAHVRPGREGDRTGEAFPGGGDVVAGQQRRVGCVAGDLQFLRRGVDVREGDGETDRLVLVDLDRFDGRDGRGIVHGVDRQLEGRRHLVDAVVHCHGDVGFAECIFQRGDVEVTTGAGLAQDESVGRDEVCVGGDHRVL